MFFGFLPILHSQKSAFSQKLGAKQFFNDGGLCQIFELHEGFELLDQFGRQIHRERDELVTLTICGNPCGSIGMDFLAWHE